MLKDPNSRGMLLQGLGIGAQMLANTMPMSDEVRGGLSGAGSILGGIGSVMMGGPLAKIMGTIQIITGLVEGIGALIVTTEEKIEKYNEAVDKANNEQLQTGDELKTLTDYAAKFD